MKTYYLQRNKFTRIILILAVCGLTLAINTNAAPPTNDNLVNAEVLSSVAGTTAGTTIEATRETVEFSHGVTETDTVYRTVWFQWTAAQTKPVVFEVTSAGFDASMAIYTGINHPLTGITRNNDTVGSRPRIELLAVSGMTYKIVIGIYNDQNAAGGTFNLQWSHSDTPTNDNFAQALNLQNSSGDIAVTNQSSTAETGEPDFGDGKTVWFNFTNTTPNDFSLTFSTVNSENPMFDTTLAVYTGAALNSLSTVVKNDNTPATFKNRVTFLAKSGVTYRLAVDSKNQPSEENIRLSWRITRVEYFTDFATQIGSSGEVYYDEAADISVFRPSNGFWYWLDSFDGTFRVIHFGQNGDKPVAADYDGDGRSDIAVTRTVGGLKIWHIRNSFDGSYKVVQWGLSGDREVSGDYDFDGRADIAVFRPSTNVWYIRRSSDNQFFIKEFGLSGDIPVSGDFKNTPPGTDLAVFRPSNGTWFIFDGVNTIYAPFGTNGDIPVAGYYDIDGKSDLAVFRPSNSTWYYLASSNNEFRFFHWGLPGDIPLIGDFDSNANNLYDFVVYRPGENMWYVLKSEGFVTAYSPFGLPGDIPVSSLIP